MRTAIPVLVLLSLCATASSNDYDDEEVLARRLLADLVSITGVPALSVAVWRRGESLAEIAVGTVNLELGTPAEPYHLFRLANMHGALVQSAM